MNSPEKRIYLDHSATSPLHPSVIEHMLPYLTRYFGNPSSIHRLGVDARRGIEDARSRVAAAIGANPEEIIFTSGGTESDNLALVGAARALKEKGNHIITSLIEHHAVLNTCRFLAENGFEVTCVPVDEYGRVDPLQVEKAIRKTTILISVMLANNEIGTIEPVAAIGAVGRDRKICVHTDAVQAVGKIPVNVDILNVDMLSLSAHKINGPKGVGALYIRRGTTVLPLLHGGHQEKGIRNGTENVAGIVGLGRACELASDELESRSILLGRLRDGLQSRICEKIDHIHVNGHPLERLPNILSISVMSAAGDEIVRHMDRKGISISAGAACTSQSVSISHVITATGLKEDFARGTVRLSIGYGNTEAEMTLTADALAETVQKLRAISELESSLGKRRCS